MTTKNTISVANKYLQARLGGLLKIGKAQVVCTVQQNDKEKYYLVVDVVKGIEWLVPIAERMKWKNIWRKNEARINIEKPNRHTHVEWRQAVLFVFNIGIGADADWPGISDHGEVFGNNVKTYQPGA